MGGWLGLGYLKQTNEGATSMKSWKDCNDIYDLCDALLLEYHGSENGYDCIESCIHNAIKKQRDKKSSMEEIIRVVCTRGLRVPTSCFDEDYLMYFIEALITRTVFETSKYLNEEYDLGMSEDSCRDVFFHIPR